MHSSDGTHTKHECSTTVYKQVGVEAEVTLIPHVKCGKAAVTCLASRLVTCDGESYDDRRQHRHGKCKVRVLQDLCVAIPVLFRVEARCETGRVECGPASTDPALCFGDESGSSSDSSSSSSSSSDTSSNSSDDACS
jgi:hypothetical protein